MLSILVVVNFFWSKPLVPGFDTPFYLTEIRSFSKAFPNPLTYPYLDRYLTIAFPGLLSKVFHIDPVNSYRISISIIYVAISLVLFKLFKNITKKSSTASILSSALVVSPFLLTYSTTLFANFTGFLVLFSFFAIETSNDFKCKNIVLGIIFGLIFFVHNFSTVSIGLIIATYYLLKLIFFRDLKVLRVGATVFILAALVGFVGLSRYLNIKISLPVNEVSRASTPNISEKVSNITIVIPSSQPVILGDEKERILASFKEHTGKFWLYLFPLLFVSLSFVVRKELRKNKRLFILPLAIFIPSLILTFQPLYHLNFLPERFVSLVCLSSYFFYVSIISLPSFKKYLIPLAILPLLLNYLSSDSLILNKGYRSFTNDEISVYKTANLIMQKDSVVITASDHGYWSQYFLEGYQIQTGESFVSCGTINEEKYYGAISFTIGKLLGEKDPKLGTELLNKLHAYFPNKKLYIFSDTGLNCGHGKVLQKIGGVKQILQQNNWYLYETI